MSLSKTSEFFNELKSGDDYRVEAAKLEFAIELKNFMEREGVTNTVLAERLKVSKPMVSKLLRGDTNLTIETMVRACRSAGGNLFLRVVREGCSARMFELAKTTVEHPNIGLVQAARSVMSRTDHISDVWLLSANDFDQTDNGNEAQPLAA